VPFYRFIKSWQAKLQHIFRSDAPEFEFMAEWIAIAQWKDCVQMARPGIIFEVRNAEGQSLFTPCVNPLPPMPFDWKSPPLMFRAIPEPAAQRSTPIPPPKGER